MSGFFVYSGGSGLNTRAFEACQMGSIPILAAFMEASH